MKSHILSYVLVSFFVIISAAQSQTVTVDGYALLQNRSSYDGIQVILHRTAPADTVFTLITDDSGYYTGNVYYGIYDVTFSKASYYSQTSKDVKLVLNTRLDSVLLQSAGLSGNLSGILKKGDYIVGDSIWITKEDTLTIEPGTRLFFKKGIQFVVYGILYAIGTENDSIIFTRNFESGDNPDSLFWGGIKFVNYSSAPTLYETSKLNYCHISFSNDKAIYSEACSPTFQNLLISDCIAPCIQLYVSKPSLTNIKFINNKTYITNLVPGSITACLDILKSLPKIENIEIANNKSKYLAGIHMDQSIPPFNWGSVEIFNNILIHDNLGPAFDLIYGLSYINLVIFNNSSFINNAGTSYFGGNKLILNNCIIANNADFKIYNNNYINIFSSDIFDNQGGLNCFDKWVGVNFMKNKKGDSCDVYGNIMLDPQFNNPAVQDYTLKPSSPCIDAGVNDSVKTSKDLLGNVRIWDGNMDGDTIVDMGCYEYGSSLSKTIIVIDENFENGLPDWTITKNNGSSNTWSLSKDVNYAYSGKNCLFLGSNSSGSNSTISTPFVDLPNDENLMLTFWLCSKAVSKAKETNENPQTSNDNSLTISINIADDIKNTIELLKIAGINATWTKYEVDLGKYGGKLAKISFNGIVDGSHSLITPIILDDIKVGIDKPTAVNEQPPVIYDLNAGLIIYPNPVSNILTISGLFNPRVYPGDVNVSKIRIYNLMAIEMLSTPVNSVAIPTGGGQIQIDVSGLSAGMYFVQIGNKVENFVKLQ